MKKQLFIAIFVSLLGITTAQGAAPQTTRLIDAVIKGDIDTVKDLINKGANLNLQDQFGYTALDIAASNPNLREIYNILLDAGAKFNRYGFTPEREKRIEQMRKKQRENFEFMMHNLSKPGQD